MKFTLSQVKPELPDRRHGWPALSRKDMLGRPNFFARVPRLIREFKVPQRRRRRKRHLKSDFTFFETAARLSQLAHFVQCRQTFLDLNS